MAMKQTQTKMFDFSDVGLDFCAGSKNLFPDRFKKMLALGYNTQTVSSVSVTGNQVVLTYGVNHGYVADRVLRLNASNLNGEYVVDSVTTNTVTLTIDNAPASVSGGFTTFVAPLGWQLMYEQANIQVYKFKALDESDLFIRLCFENNAARRSNISPCIGKSFDASTGFINDGNALQATANIVSPAIFSWDFTDSGSSAGDNYTYAQGYSTYGRAMVAGSAYHFLIASWQSPSTWRSSINGFVPQSCNLEKLKYPVLIGWRSANGSSSRSGYGQAYQYNTTDATGYGDAYVGNYRVFFSLFINSTTNVKLVDANVASASFYPSEIENFNTTSAHPLSIFLVQTRQFVGFTSGGIYQCRYANSNTPANTYQTSPSLTSDIDLSSKMLVHLMSEGTNSNSGYFAMPVEEIKIA